MNDKEFLEWLIDRLVHVYNESPNTDFIHKLRKIADKIGYLDNCNYHTIVAQSNYLKNFGE